MNTKRDFTIGMTFAFSAAIAYGISAVLIKQGLANLAPPLVGAAVSLFAGTIVLAFIGLRKTGGNLRQEKRSVGLLLIAGIFAGLGIMCNYFALSMAPVTVVTPVTSTNPLFALILSHFFLGRLEKITLRVVLGTILVVAGVALITIGRAA